MIAWLGFFYHPFWAVSTALLAAVVRLQMRNHWNPQTCAVRLTGKTAIVTGANTGIGKFIALDFARRGARVILACRSEARGTAALNEIREKTGNSDVHLRLVDLSCMDSVRAFAERILKEEKALHILVNNAAVSGLPRNITKDGFEESFATNHLGPFLLTNLLLDLMKSSSPSRIVSVSSVNHKKDVTANSVHPGIVMTEVMRHYSFWIRWIFNFIGFFFFKSPEAGAVSTIYCAVAEELEGVTGKYVDSDCSLTLPIPLARDAALAVKDFEFCERLTSKL
ncbi:retinol dehydrogenase 11 isoform X2 [Neolamprologus brichardi]|uniref:retinol dehydrogenase 11 isoform X2 n=1 Tax=Neolamprologus brichardi TaxID=32507 RepID=UPI0003EC5607|nr:retinol dehydrogenase 11 isoform X2 [Neolamprologus brichardi]